MPRGYDQILNVLPFDHFGRTSFWDPLVGWKNKTTTREQAVTEIALHYREFVNLFEAAIAAPAGVR